MNPCHSERQRRVKKQIDGGATRTKKPFTFTEPRATGLFSPFTLHSQGPSHKPRAPKRLADNQFSAISSMNSYTKFPVPVVSENSPM
jgi:hypothetical protein